MLHEINETAESLKKILKAEEKEEQAYRRRTLVFLTAC